jgi:hypothetical protein
MTASPSPHAAVQKSFKETSRDFLYFSPSFCYEVYSRRDQLEPATALKQRQHYSETQGEGTPIERTRRVKITTVQRAADDAGGEAV